jgi:cell division septal protein FtsQ
MPERITYRSRSKSPGSIRRPVRRVPPERGRRSRARLGKTYEQVMGAPMSVAAGAGLVQRMGLRVPQTVGVALLVLLAATLALLFSSDAYFVRGADIHGFTWLSPGTIYQIAGIDGVSIFYLDPTTIANKIKGMAAVESASVTCRLPNQVAIQLVERTPLAVWQTGGVQYWVDGQGVLFERGGDLPDPTIIVEQDAVQRSPGERVDRRVVQTAVGLSAHLQGARIYAYSALDGISFDLPDDLRVLMPTDEDSGTMVTALQSLREYIASQGQKPHLIDLRYGNHPYWR